jgi:hypothetical protein
MRNFVECCVGGEIAAAGDDMTGRRKLEPG